MITWWWTISGDNCSCINWGYYIHEREHYHQINSHGVNWWSDNKSDRNNLLDIIERPVYEYELEEIKYWIKKGESYK